MTNEVGRLPVDAPADPITEHERDRFRTMARMLRHEEVLGKRTNGRHPFDIEFADDLAGMAPEECRGLASQVNAAPDPVTYSGQEVTYGHAGPEDSRA